MGRCCPLPFAAPRLTPGPALACVPPVTSPRRFLSGQSRANSRRVVERRFYLKPTRQTTAILLYLLARALQGRQLKLHTFSIQPNHYHVVITDCSEPGQPSDVSAFYQHFNAVSARALNAHLGRCEALWKEGSFSDRELWGEESLHAQLLYAWIQPLKDGWVEDLEDYAERAVHFLPKDLGRTLKVSRPKFAFFGGARSPHRPPTDPDALRRWRRERDEEAEQERLRWRRRNAKKNKRRSRARVLHLEKEHMRDWRAEHLPEDELRPTRSSLPDEIELQIDVPPGFEGLDLQEVRDLFQRRLDHEVERVRALREEQGRPKPSLRRLDALDAFSSAGPSRPDPEGYDPIDYRGDKEIRKAIKSGRSAYLGAYRNALRTHRRRRERKRPSDSGGHKMRKTRKTRRPVFPLGTYRMLRFEQVKVDVPDDYLPPLPP